MLLESIDETHKSTYDFLYLPIDFKVIACLIGQSVVCFSELKMELILVPLPSE